MHKLTPAFLAMTLAAAAIPASAAPYVGSDRVYIPSNAAATNALAAESAWLAAVSAAGPLYTQDFEGMTRTRTPQLITTLAPGVTMTTPAGLVYQTGFQIDNLVSNQLAYTTRGFNTTPAGQNYAAWQCDSPPIQTIDFFFTQPIQAFSFWFTGTGSGGWLFDRFTHHIDWDGLGPGGFFFNVHGLPHTAYWDNALFVGFFDPTASSTHVRFNVRFPSNLFGSGGAYAIDDIRWVPAAPEPLGLFVLLGPAIRTLTRRRAR